MGLAKHYPTVVSVVLCVIVGVAPQCTSNNDFSISFDGSSAAAFSVRAADQICSCPAGLLSPKVTVSGNWSTGSLAVSGPTTFSGSTSIVSSASFPGGLSVTGGGLTVTAGGATLQQTLSVGGTSSFGGLVTLTGGARFADGSVQTTAFQPVSCPAGQYLSGVSGNGVGTCVSFGGHPHSCRRVTNTFSGVNAQQNCNAGEIALGCQGACDSGGLRDHRVVNGGTGCLVWCEASGVTSYIQYLCCSVL